MAMKKVKDLQADATVKFEKQGQTFTGHLLGNKKFVSEMGPGIIHIFSTPTGNVGLYGSADLNSKLANVPEGALTEVTFQGKIKLKGGRQMKKFEVSFDEDDSLDIAPSVQLSAQDDDGEGSTASLEDLGDDSELIEESDEAEVEARPTPRQAAPAKPSSSVQNLLQKRSQQQNKVA